MYVYIYIYTDTHSGAFLQGLLWILTAKLYRDLELLTIDMSRETQRTPRSAGHPGMPPINCVVHFCTTKPGWVAQTPELFEYQSLGFFYGQFDGENGESTGILGTLLCERNHFFTEDTVGQNLSVHGFMFCGSVDYREELTHLSFPTLLMLPRPHFTVVSW